MKFLWGGVAIAAICFLGASCSSVNHRVVQNLIVIDDSAIKEGNSWPDQQLNDAFNKYWGYRAEGDADQTWLIEAPYVHEMMIPARYVTFVHGARNNNWLGIRISKIDWKTTQLVDIDFYLKIKDSNNREHDALFQDEWVVLGHQWYHAFKDPFFLPD